MKQSNTLDTLVNQSISIAMIATAFFLAHSVCAQEQKLKNAKTDKIFVR